MKFLSFLALVILVMSSANARASEEGSLPLSKFSLSSDGLGNSGPVSVSGTASETGVTSLTVKAFGRTFKMNPKQLAPLKGMQVNGLQTTFEEGFKATGGKSVYIQFSRGFSSGIREKKVVEVNEAGEIHVD